MADYEEQALLTGIMSGRPCTICTVPPSKRENLQQQWPIRTHEMMRKQIAKQRQMKASKGE